MRADHLRNEARFLPRSIEDLVELQDRLVAAGHSPAVASGIASWLARKAIGEDDATSHQTRARYRKILAELEVVDPGPPGGGDDDELRPAAEVVDVTKRRRRSGPGKLAAAWALALAAAAGGGVQHQAPADASVTPVPVVQQADLTERRRSRRRAA